MSFNDFTSNNQKCMEMTHNLRSADKNNKFLPANFGHMTSSGGMNLLIFILLIYNMVKHINLRLKFLH